MEVATEGAQTATPVSYTIDLPLPWRAKRISLKPLGPVTYMVGPNGAGKSQFANALKGHLGNCRLLGTNRLDMMAPALSMFGDQFAMGIDRSHFGQIRTNCIQSGAALDTFILLEERLDIQIRVEATLSSLFNRDIRMDWDSGRLVPMVSAPGGDSYRLDRQECHGIRELMVLLAHLYDDKLEHLIIDEPELNLHPQYQSFFMQEVRKITGMPEGKSGKKKVILITHSPFIIELSQYEDLDSIYSFSADFEVPRTLPQQKARNKERLASLIPHLSAYHKQLFFSDNPIFVEGISDARMIQAIQLSRGASIVSAGSCIIEADGCEEINKFLDLCIQLGKQAFFLYDLDSLFCGNLRQCVQDDGTISGFLGELGLGTNFQRFVGTLDQVLHNAITTILNTASGTATPLQAYLTGLGAASEIISDQQKGPLAKLAILYDLGFQKAELIKILGHNVVTDIQGKLDQTINALAQKRIFVLPAGTLEDYLPSFQQSHYGKKSDGAKTTAVDQEILELQSRVHTESELKAKYGAFFDNILKLPAKKEVDIESVLKRHLSKYIHDVQAAFTRNPNLTQAEIQTELNRNPKYSNNFAVENFVKTEGSSFTADIKIRCGELTKLARISDQTVAGMQRFVLLDA